MDTSKKVSARLGTDHGVASSDSKSQSEHLPACLDNKREGVGGRKTRKKATSN